MDIDCIHETNGSKYGSKFTPRGKLKQNKKRA